MINSGVAVDAGFNPASDAIFLEPVDDHARPYVNIIVARKKMKTIKRIKNSRRLSNRRHSQSNRENIKRIKRACMGNIREKIRKMTSIGGIFMTTTISTNQLKDLIQYRLPEYQALALDIHEHPEVSNYEFYSSAALIKQLEKKVLGRKEVAGHRTAFDARYISNKPGPTIAFWQNSMLYQVLVMHAGIFVWYLLRISRQHSEAIH